MIQAPLGRDEPVVYPLGIATLASHLPDPYKILLLDPNLEGTDACLRKLSDFSPHVIGFSLRNIDSQMRRDLFYYYLEFRHFSRSLKSKFPGVFFVVGGSGFSLFPRQIMQENPWIDAGVYLEGEEIFPEMLANLDHLQDVPGVLYRDQHEIRFNGPGQLPDASDIRIPRYDLLDPRPYSKSGGIGVQTKRGCPMHCIYCTYPHLNGSTYRYRPVNNILDEISCLYHQYGIRELTFVDGVFNLPGDWAVQLLEQLNNRHLKLIWHAWFTEIGFDREFALLCRDSGCREFSFSPDGYSDPTLKNLGKSIRKQDILNVFQVARDVDDIRVAFNFFWNPPGQTAADFIKMLGFAVKCKWQLGRRAGGIIFGSPRIEPHTGLWQLALKEGFIRKDQNLLPPALKDLHGLFYSNPGTRVLDLLFWMYRSAWNLKRMFREGGLGKKT